MTWDEDDRVFIVTLALRVCNILIHALGDGVQVTNWRNDKIHVQAAFARLARGEGDK